MPAEQACGACRAAGHASLTRALLRALRAASEWWRATIRDAEMHVVEGEGHISLVGRHAAAILQHLLDSLPAVAEQQQQA